MKCHSVKDKNERLTENAMPPHADKSLVFLTVNIRWIEKLYAGQVQSEQVTPSGRQQASQLQGQATSGNRVQSAIRPQRTLSVASGNSMDQSMARAFPGLFKARKGFTPASKKRPAKSTPIQFLLVNKSLERTPKASDELMLLQAGLGRRTIAILEDNDHSEISKLLLETYPKMELLEGAWMLYKAVGGSGQRKLNVVAPEGYGYTGSYLIKTAGGKGCLYIMPIQNSLDVSPLPYSSKEFEKMPKATCAKCHTDMPVQLLAVHVQKCEPDIWINSDCETLGDELDSLMTSTSTCSAMMDVQVIYECEHKTIGEIMAVSITQDGPPPNFFLEWIYNFICTGEINKDQLSKSDLTDADLLDLIDKPDADFLVMALSPTFSEAGSVKRQRESRIVNFLQDFIQSLEDEGTYTEFLIITSQAVTNSREFGRS
ncbi:hypothetical protein E1301_Tti012593 [Triplophysa tibetana]|uniref:G2/M phase-specific E3 ubiquitin-protein ligase n=1 Tax=Triplophysa tibetana TaxID=1572043 RepID=A0A5A9NNH5_9TELE|nr:hypothetical protein E1301_Tti012593 [Triplophysa tibetana]